MIEQIVRPYIPVNSFIRDPAIVTETPPEPDIGIRWGRPSRFEYSNQGKKVSRPLYSSPFSSASDDDDEKLHEETQIVKLYGTAYRYNIENKDDGTVIQMTDQLLFRGSRVVQRYDDAGRRQMPGAEAISYYFTLKLNEDA